MNKNQKNFKTKKLLGQNFEASRSFDKNGIKKM